MMNVESVILKQFSVSLGASAQVDSSQIPAAAPTAQPAERSRRKGARSTPWLSVIVPAFNEERLIVETLGAIRGALEENRLADRDYEIVVCDNNSSDGTAKLAYREGATVVFEPINHIGRARNTGASAARGDWLLFVDADTMPCAALIADTFEVIRSQRYVGGSSTVRFGPCPLWWRTLWDVKNRIVSNFNLAFGAYVFCRRDAFDEVGGFSPHLYVVEEVDFVNRVKRYGRRRKLDFTVLCDHPVLTSARKANLPFGWHLKASVWIALTPYTGTQRPSQFRVWYDGPR